MFAHLLSPLTFHFSRVKRPGHVSRVATTFAHQLSPLTSHFSRVKCPGHVSRVATTYSHSTPPPLASPFEFKWLSRSSCHWWALCAAHQLPLVSPQGLHFNEQRGSSKSQKWTAIFRLKFRRGGARRKTGLRKRKKSIKHSQIMTQKQSPKGGPLEENQTKMTARSPPRSSARSSRFSPRSFTRSPARSSRFSPRSFARSPARSSRIIFLRPFLESPPPL